MTFAAGMLAEVEVSVRFITVTSDNYVDATVRMIASLRTWHPDDPVVVYTLEQGWSANHEKAFADLGVAFRRLPESDHRHRRGSMGQSVFACWKLNVFLDQSEPFVFLDSDTLVLRPLHRLISRTLEQGWFSVNEGTTLAEYARGELSRYVVLGSQQASRSGFNTGVLGCRPQEHREVFSLAAQWAARIQSNYLGDQGLLNLAWHQLRGQLPRGESSLYNGGWHTDDTLDLAQAVLHFARPQYTPEQKLRDHQRIWAAWPRGIALAPLVETAFWQASMPHPWPWINQCVQRRYRDFVEELRRKSRTALDPRGLIVADRWQACLLDRTVLRETQDWWRTHAPCFRGVPHRPTFHLSRPGQARSSTAIALIRGIHLIQSHCP